MDINGILEFGNISPEFRSEILAFLKLCDRLDFLTEAENNALLSDDGIQDRQAAYRKILLLEQMEERTIKVFRRVKEDAPHNLALQTHLIRRVQDVQKKLKVNTGLHLHVLQASPLYGGENAQPCH